MAFSVLLTAAIGVAYGCNRKLTESICPVVCANFNGCISQSVQLDSWGLYRCELYRPRKEKPVMLRRD